MPTFTGPNASGVIPSVTVNDAAVAGLTHEITLPANAVLALGDILDLGNLPPNVQVMDVTLLTDDLDSNATPLITLSVGELNAAKTNINGTEWISNSAVGQNGGMSRANSAAAFLAGNSGSVQRRVGVKVTAAPATSNAGGKKVAVIFHVRA